MVIEDHTHCIRCGRVCYYPDKPVEVVKAHSMRLCWNCYNSPDRDKKIQSWTTEARQC